MSIEVTCKCGKVIYAPDEAAGKKGRCKACGAIMDVPEPALEAILAIDIDGASNGPPPLPSAVSDAEADVDEAEDSEESDPSPTAVPLTPYGERQLLKEKFVMVTDRRIVIGAARVYAVAHLVSIESDSQSGDKVVPICLSLFGAVFVIGGLAIGGVIAAAGVVIGAASIAAAAYVASKTPDTQLLRLWMSSGQSETLKDEDAEFVKRVRVALVNAMVTWTVR